ncbi:MAG TPA: HD domain-containing phosphohydrolase [Blastocatellia bacterium]|nr:HD domain-containing phosphohydrolase [Blastocatellia bacterium]
MQQFIPSENRSRLLIVDDEDSVRLMLARHLSEQYQCDAVPNAEAALARRQERNYDLIITDISMPGRSGLELLSEIRRADPEACVIVCSGTSDIDNAIEALRRGAFDYIPKPFRMDQLSLIIERALRQQAQLAAQREHVAHLEEQVAARTSELRQMNATVNEMFEELYLSYRSTLQSLATALETRQVEPYGHVQRVSAYCLRLGRELNLSDSEMMALEHGALLHDIGQIALPDYVLHKSHSLSEDEWTLMRRHIDYGAQILSSIKFLHDAKLLVLQHHEKWDGSGYPLGLRENEICLNARIFAVADALDAITSDRSYRPAQGFDVAEKEIRRCGGTHFDPAVVAAFFKVPRNEWEDLRAQAITSSTILEESRRRGIRSMIMIQKTGRLRMAN